MSSYAVYVVDEEEGIKEYVESFTESHDAYAERDRLNEEIQEDEEATAHAVVVEEP